MSPDRLPVPLPDPPLASALITLRPWRLDDAADLSAAWNDPEVTQWTGHPSSTDLRAARRWIAGDTDRRARGLALDLVIDLDGKVVGEVGLAHIDVVAGTAEIGWWVRPSHRGQGVASSAAELLATWALEELSVKSIVARCHPGNPASGGVARAAGFVREASCGDVAADAPDVWRCC